MTDCQGVPNSVPLSVPLPFSTPLSLPLTLGGLAWVDPSHRPSVVFGMVPPPASPEREMASPLLNPCFVGCTREIEPLHGC
jgi:hypothetical protein